MVSPSENPLNPYSRRPGASANLRFDPIVAASGMARICLAMPKAPRKTKKASQVSKATKQRLLREGVKLLGRAEIASRLRVPLARLNLWLRGRGAMPDAKLPWLADRILQKLSEQ